MKENPAKNKRKNERNSGKVGIIFCVGRRKTQKLGTRRVTFQRVKLSGRFFLRLMIPKRLFTTELGEEVEFGCMSVRSTVLRETK